jgi:thioredoxin-like negative regulator of GroEL
VALALLRPVVKRDPLCTDCSYRYARAALMAGLYQEAEQEIMRFKALVHRPGGEITLVTARLMLGDIEGARDVIATIGSDPEDARFEEESKARRLYLQLLAALAEDKPEGVLEGIARLDGMRSGDISIGSTDIAKLYAMAGRRDEAFAHLDIALQDIQLSRIASVTRSPFLANLHDDPRWMDLLESTGMAPHQLAAIEFNPKLPGTGSE